MAAWLPWVIGGLTSLAGAFLGNKQQQKAQARMDPLIAQRQRMTARDIARRAMLDPLFKEFLSRQLMRSRRAPMFGGLRRQPFEALETPVGGLPALPPPQLIGEEPQAAGAPTPRDPMEMFRTMLGSRGGRD